MPLLRSRMAVRRARWMFMKVFLVAMAVLAAVYAVFVLTRVAVERLPWG